MKFFWGSNICCVESNSWVADVGNPDHLRHLGVLVINGWNNRAMAMVLLGNSGSKLRDFAFQPNNHELRFFKVKSEPPEEATRTTEDAQIAYIG